MESNLVFNYFGTEVRTGEVQIVVIDVDTYTAQAAARVSVNKGQK